MRRWLPALCLALAWPAPAPAAQERGDEIGLDWNAIAQAIVDRMDLQAGENVLLLSHPGRFEPLLGPLRRAIRATGAADLGNLDVLAGSAEGAAGPSAQASRWALRRALREVDVTVKLPGASVQHAAYLALQDLLRQGRGRTVHFHWEGAYGLDGAVLPVDGRVSRTYLRALTQTDYAQVGARQRDFEQAMRRGQVRVTTPAGTDLRFRIGDRPVTRQDGDASASRAARARNLIDLEVELPCGAIRVAPLEETVQGVIAFPDGIWNGRPVKGLRLRLERGRVTGIEADQGAGAARAEIDAAGEAGRSFREFALGFNPLLAIPDEDPWIPYYGYGAGVVRLSLGDNGELGGRVSGGYVRWNFFADATVEAGGEVWVRAGKLLK